LKSDERRFLFIVNPEAGRGRSRKIDSILCSALKHYNIHFLIQRTAGAGDATHIAQTRADEFDVVVAVGGDGTSNEVANGLLGSGATMGVIPCGSGNDFGKMLGMSRNIERAVADIVACRTERIDSGRVKLRDEEDRLTLRSFVNSIGIGFDAVVAYESQQLKNLRGIPLYFLSVLRSLKRLKPHSFEMALNGIEHKDNYSLVCVGNGGREGGGFLMTPGADPRDGLFRICSVRHVSMLRALRILPTLLTGRHGRFAEVEFFDSPRVRIGSSKPFVVHCDGEIIGTANKHVEVELNAKSLEVVVGAPGLRAAT